jgi:uncharacterized protein (TIGR02118 family)
MIKTQLLLKRKPGMTLEAFSEYWMSAHFPVTAKVSGVNRQTISIVRPDFQRSGSPWDGLVNTWWESAVELATTSQNNGHYVTLSEFSDFIDMSINGPLVVHEINPLAPKEPPRPEPDLFKIVNPLHKRKDLSYEAFSAYWRGHHAKLNRALPNMHAYIQNHILPDFQTGDISCDGIAESWFNSWAEIRELGKSNAHTLLKEDEANLLEPGKLQPMICREYSII